MPSRTQLANAIRVLSMDAVKQANSGHTGMPMGMADIAEVLWNDFLHHNPKNPKWLNRDRFILSNGHGSMLHYSLLHLTGYDLSLDEIKHFRQLHSKTPGHPEFGYTPGVETTTGPLGQGLANAVGMAIAERVLAKEFNRDGFEIINHHTYVFMGDGCLMEGISHEACSLAGVLKLGKLIAFWDDNGISIDGHVADWMNDDTPKRFESYHWHVIRDVNGHDADAIKQAILIAQSVTDRPTIICCKTEIAHGAAKSAGTHHAHGAITNDEEISATKRALNWSEIPFEIPHDIYQAWNAEAKGAQVEKQWQDLLHAYQAQHPELAKAFSRRMQNELPENWQDFSATYLATLVQQNKEMATRKASQHCLNLLGQVLPELSGGSADLTESNCTYHQNSNELNYIFYGVREFGMSAIMNGIALHGGFIPYGGTFLVFSDYARNAVRMAAIMKQRVIFIYTHDSIGVGEDGPTHQPIEHVNMLRLTPNLNVWRPCDLVETAIAWQNAIEQHHTPSAFILTRQNLPAMTRDEKIVNNIKRGGYVLKDFGGLPEIILIATGSEVSLALESAEILAQQLQKNIRVVSMPCADIFLQQDHAYKESVLPSHIKTRIAIEMGSTAYWYRFVGLDGLVIGLDSFGESAPAKILFEFFGFTTSKIIDKITQFIKGETL